MIFKLQRPIMTTEPIPYCLVYNKDRSIEFQIELDDIVFGGEFKIYAHAEIKDNEFHLLNQVEAQDW